MKIFQLKPNLKWAVHRGSGGNWIGVCDLLGLTVQSETYAALTEDIEQTLDAIMQDLLATNDDRR